MKICMLGACREGDGGSSAPSVPAWTFTLVLWSYCCCSYLVELQCTVVALQWRTWRKNNPYCRRPGATHASTPLQLQPLHASSKRIRLSMSRREHVFITPFAQASHDPDRYLQRTRWQQSQSQREREREQRWSMNSGWIDSCVVACSIDTVIYSIYACSVVLKDFLVRINADTHIFLSHVIYPRPLVSWISRPSGKSFFPRRAADSWG